MLYCRQMNEFERISEFNNRLLSAITLHRRKQDWNVFIFVINSIQTFVSQIHRVVGAMEGSSIFSVPLDMKLYATFTKPLH